LFFSPDCSGKLFAVFCKFLLFKNATKEAFLKGYKNDEKQKNLYRKAGLASKN
jgi:hypothetical protein